VAQTEIIREFLLESNENLTRLDQEIVEIEQRPNDKALLSSIFRTIHTIKGSCGFLGFTNLERIAHEGEHILSQVRNGERELRGATVAVVLEMGMPSVSSSSRSRRPEPKAIRISTR
jgi:two-component system, chemotaxis family, sensor kinase CheA